MVPIHPSGSDETINANLEEELEELMSPVDVMLSEISEKNEIDGEPDGTRDEEDSEAWPHRNNMPLPTTSFTFNRRVS